MVPQKVEEAGKEGKMDQSAVWEHIHKWMAYIVGNPSDQFDQTCDGTRRRSRHYRRNLVIVVFGVEGRTTDVLEPSVPMLGDGPKGSVNRGVDDCGAKFSVGRLNQIVLMQSDMVNAPTRHNLGSHEFLIRKM